MKMIQNDKTAENIRCAIYVRTASMSDFGRRIFEQMQKCRELAEERGWIVAEVCIEGDLGKSGETLVGR